jgi:hypothetical protein
MALPQPANAAGRTRSGPVSIRRRLGRSSTLRPLRPSGSTSGGLSVGWLIGVAVADAFPLASVGASPSVSVPT